MQLSYFHFPISHFPISYMQLSYFSLSYFVYAAFRFHFPISHFPISQRPVRKACARRPGRLRSGVLRAAPQRFRFRSDRSARSRRCAACTPGCPHAAAAAHTSPASRTRKIKDEELLKSAVLGAPVDCCPACRARHTNASDSGRTGPHVATDVSSAPGVGRMPLHRLAPRPTRRLQKCCCRRMQQRATLLGTAWVLDVR
jgi:hypothetical protein